MIGEMESCLTRRVSGANEVNVEAMRRACLAACCSIVDAFTDEAVEAVHREAAPGDPRRENHGSRTNDVIAVQKHFSRSRINARDCARHQNLRPEPARLLQGPPRELIARDAV